MSFKKNIPQCDQQKKTTTDLPTIVARSGYDYSRKIAQQNTLIKLIHAAYKEGIFPGHRIVFYLHLCNPPTTVKLCCAKQAFSFIYNRDINQEFTLQVYFFDRKLAQNIPSLIFFLQEILKPYVQKKLQDEFEENNWHLAEQEIFNACDCDTLAVIERLKITQEIEIKSQAYKTTWAWLTSTQFSRHELEKILIRMGSIDGHPLHPMGKMRVIIKGESELNWLDLTNYFPEFGNQFQLPLLAISEAQIRVIKQEKQSEWRTYFQEHFPEAYAQWINSLVENGLSTEVYYPFPVHPLNLKNVIHKFRRLVTTKQLILTNSSIDVYPMISSRSLLPQGGGARIKVTMPQLLLTSVARSIAPARAHSAPILSDLLEHILKVEQNFQHSLRIISEPFGLYFYPENTPKNKQKQVYQEAYNLSLIMRSNAQEYLQAGEWAIPLTNLFSRWGKDPKTGRISKPLILDIIHGNGVKTKAEAKSYFIDYVDKVLHGLLGIFIRYGISIEAHQQNTLVVFNHQGTIQGILVRDLAGGIEIYRELLEINQGTEYQIAKKLYPGYIDKTLDTKLTSPFGQFIHAVLHGHILPLVAIFQTRFALNNQDLLSIIKSSIIKYINLAKIEHISRIKPQARDKYLRIIAHLEQLFWREKILDKCLLTMRIQQTQQRISIANENPFDFND